VGPPALCTLGATLILRSSRRPQGRTPKPRGVRPWVSSPSSGTEQKGSREAPSALYFGSHLELTEFATPIRANSQAAPQRGLGYKSLLRYQASHPALAVLDHPCFQLP